MPGIAPARVVGLLDEGGQDLSVPPDVRGAPRPLGAQTDAPRVRSASLEGDGPGLSHWRDAVCDEVVLCYNHAG
jgi:hypothetical protein